MAAQDKRIRESLEDALGSQQKKVWKMFQKASFVLQWNGQFAGSPRLCLCPFGSP